MGRYESVFLFPLKGSDISLGVVASQWQTRCCSLSPAGTLPRRHGCRLLGPKIRWAPPSTHWVTRREEISAWFCRIWTWPDRPLARRAERLSSCGHASQPRRWRLAPPIGRQPRLRPRRQMLRRSLLVR
jgi:hypothetical protein